MNINRVLLVFLVALLGVARPASADPSPTVLPAVLPLPLPAESPMPPDQLRAQNPWNLSMTGSWRFQLTHGQIIADHFALSTQETEGLRTSSSQTGNPPENAFDNDMTTRWCASSGTMPQWLQIDLGQTRKLNNVILSWERPEQLYQFTIDGSADGKKWTILSDQSKNGGMSDGAITLTNSSARYVRLSVTGAGNGWASLWDFQVHYVGDSGQDQRWTPSAPDQSSPPNLDSFASTTLDDHGWDKMAVPSNWEMAGYSVPTYNSVDDTVGLYRRWVTVPSTWTGRRIFWRFDGAMDGAEIYVNGTRIGYHESGYTAFDVDLSSYVHPGQSNLFAVRLSKTTPSSECETGDYQTLGGIYRETSLIAVPQSHVSDITVTTPLTHNYQDADFDATINVTAVPASSVSIDGQIDDRNGNPIGVTFSGQSTTSADGLATVTLSAPVTSPHLWSAEKPTLYYAVFKLSQNGTPTETVEQRFGFRQVEIKNDVVLWNGQPIKCTGICRHDFWADKGFALTDVQWKQDLSMMKAANINAIRTSHYNHANRFLELCDEQGFYVLDEVPFCWIDNLVNVPSFAPALLLRAADTVGRDKNKACVLAWSLGNENPIGPNTQQVFDLVSKLDPTRPAFASGAGPWNVTGQQLRDMHYPGPDGVQHYLDQDATKAPAVFTEQPHTMYSKADQDFDPGVSDLWSEALIKTWNFVWNQPHILGSFVWEWQNQGIADAYPDKTTDFWYGSDHLRQENNKGIVTAYRKPKPEYWIVKNVYSPVEIDSRTLALATGGFAITITNRYSFTDLNELQCKWIARSADKVVQTGTATVECPPAQTAQLLIGAPNSTTSLHLDFDHPDGSVVISANLSMPDATLPSSPPTEANGTALTVTQSPGTVEINNSLQRVSFDSASGAMLEWRAGRDILIGGSPKLDLGQGKIGHWDGFFRDDQNPVTTNGVLSVAAQPDGSVLATTKSDVLTGVGGSKIGVLNTTYSIQPDADIDVNWSLDWTAPTIQVWELGLTVPVATNLNTMRWSRDSTFTDYPAGHIGEPSGDCLAGSPLFLASKSNLHWLTLTAPDGSGLALVQSGAPLVGRALSNKDSENLLASAAICPAGPEDLSRSWFRDRDILLTQGTTTSGSFVLRAVASARR